MLEQIGFSGISRDFSVDFVGCGEIFREISWVNCYVFHGIERDHD